jgi:hypothetical protein
VLFGRIFGRLAKVSVGPLPLPPTTPSTVASRPKIQQNNSKKKKMVGRENLRQYGRHFWTKAAENRPNNFWNEKHVFMYDIFHFLSNGQ